MTYPFPCRRFFGLGWVGGVTPRPVPRPRNGLDPALSLGPTTRKRGGDCGFVLRPSPSN